MSSKTPRISATTLHVDELVDRALRGHIRIPLFQRTLKWRAHDVQQLFDSIYRGFPIGTLLMWKRPAEAGEVHLGPIHKEVGPTEDAWWVVDGQQRLISLVAALHHPNPELHTDPFVVYFDLEQPPDAGLNAKSRPFFRPHRLRPAGDTSMPLAKSLDSQGFQRWLFDFVERTGRRDLIERASGLSVRLRNYRVPIYVVETDDPETAREMFLRVNKAGRRLEAHEVFAALAPTSAAARDMTPESIAERIAADLGPIEPNAVAKSAQALQGDDVTRIRLTRRRSVEAHVPLMRRTEAGLCRALHFIGECGIPHPRLLPHRLTPVVTLARFFDRFEAPHERNLRLLRRWLWRGFFADALGSDAKTFRRAVVAVKRDEDEAVQSLLAQVPREGPVELPSTFDARKGTARLAMLVLALEGPVPPLPEAPDRFMDDDPGDIFDWLQEKEAAAFTKFPDTANLPEARFITPGVSPSRLKGALLSWARSDPDHEALRSHLASGDAARALLADDVAGFMARRKVLMIEAAERAHGGYGEPRHSDRPPLRGDAT